MKFAYDDSNYYPPMPVVKIAMALPDRAPEVGPVQAIVDTAADGTLIPLPLLKQIDAPVFDEVAVRSSFGEQYIARLFEIDLLVETIRLPSMYVVGYETSDEVILGRNVLNLLLLLLDGPAAQIDVLERRPKL